MYVQKMYIQMYIGVILYLYVAHTNNDISRLLSGYWRNTLLCYVIADIKWLYQTYTVVVSFISGGNRSVDITQVTDKLYHTRL